MTAKELRRAALMVSGKEPHPSGFGGMIADARTLAAHILSTVRDDDDEPVTYERLCFIKKPYMENRKIWWNFDGFTVSINSSGARFHCNHMPIASAQTMGQFRSLCRGLGIVLEEKETC